MKRSDMPATVSALRPARATIAWCMVGTAVYQLGFTSSNQRNTLSASKPGEQCTEAPACSDDSTAAISPWMWNSGMMLRQRSAGSRRRVAAMCPAEAQRLAPLSGTIFGREVVPEVCSTSAVSPGPAGRAVPGAVPPRSRVNAPAPPPASSTSSITGTPCRAATARAGVSMPAATIRIRARRSEM